MPFPQTQEQPPGEIKNPFRLWLMHQPLSVTQSTLARDLKVGRTTISGLLQEKPRMPSLMLAKAIERLTQGEATVEWFVANGVQNLKRSA
jgi:DNA-binding XRE family transcriptional regulator